MTPKTARKSGLPTATVAVFDMGGVLLDWNPRHLYRKLIADPQEMERFLATVTTTPWHNLQDAGTVTTTPWHNLQDAGGDPVEATRRLKAEHPGQEALI